jgi:RNA polymerase sigma-70 factor (ECF subfamily)
MRDITLSELEELRLQTTEIDVFQMDQDSFMAFYQRTARPVWAYLWRRTGDRNLADDLLQESYYRFLRARISHESESHRRNYLFRIATNLVHDHHRKQPAVSVELPEEGKPGHPATDAGSGLRTQCRTDLDRALTKLSSRQQDALWLAYAEGSSHQEIAETLGLKVGSVKLILFRARRKLVELMGGSRNGSTNGSRSAR